MSKVERFRIRWRPAPVAGTATVLRGQRRRPSRGRCSAALRPGSPKPCEGGSKPRPPSARISAWRASGRSARAEGGGEWPDRPGGAGPRNPRAFRPGFVLRPSRRAESDARRPRHRRGCAAPRRSHAQVAGGSARRPTRTAAMNVSVKSGRRQRGGPARPFAHLRARAVGASLPSERTEPTISSGPSAEVVGRILQPPVRCHLEIRRPDRQALHRIRKRASLAS